MFGRVSWCAIGHGLWPSFFSKLKTAYELRISDWSSDVCSSDLVALAHEDALLGEAHLLVELGVGLRDDELVLVVSGQVVDLVGDRALLHAAVGRLHEAERVDPGERCERTDQTDVRAFRGLDRAHPAVVRRVDVTEDRKSTRLNSSHYSA